MEKKTRHGGEQVFSEEKKTRHGGEQDFSEEKKTRHGGERYFSMEKKTRHGGEWDFSEGKQRGNKTNGRFSIRLERAEARREGKLPVADTNGNKQSRTASNRRKPCG